MHGVGKPAEPVFPWGVEHELFHVIALKAVSDMCFP
jgi:hypothetical protein